MADNKKIFTKLNNLREDYRFSPLVYIHNIYVREFIKKYAKEKLIDLGCGDRAFRADFDKVVIGHDTLDIEKRANELTYKADITNMSVVASDSYDRAFCLSVLEHVREPNKALSEINRILKKGGITVVSVPHLSRIHEAPHDYFRYTKYGLRSIIEKNGFEVIELQELGSIFTFFGHQLSTLLMLRFGTVPLFGQIALSLNYLLVVRQSLFLDKLDKNKIFANYYICAARKK